MKAILLGSVKDFFLRGKLEEIILNIGLLESEGSVLEARRGKLSSEDKKLISDYFEAEEGSEAVLSKPDVEVVAEAGKGGEVGELRKNKFLPIP